MAGATIPQRGTPIACLAAFPRTAPVTPSLSNSYSYRNNAH